MKKLFALMAVLALVAGVIAATGDILTFAVLPDGWRAQITVSGIDTGGTYNFGLGHNNDTSTAKIKITVKSPGFDTAGAPIWLNRCVVITGKDDSSACRPVRRPYNNQTKDSVFSDEGNAVLTVALSQPIFPADTIKSISVAAEFYSKGGSSTTTATPEITNGSTRAAYPQVIGNWGMWGWEKITGASFRLRATAFQYFADSGRPAACVQFYATDEHSHTVTSTVGHPVIDSTTPNDPGDSVKIIEYVGTLSTSTLTQGDTLVCGFRAFPVIGDSDAILNTATSGYTQYTPMPAPLTLLNDKTGAYGSTYARIGPAGNDGTGAVVDAAAWNPSSPPAAFATIGGAHNAICAYNSSNYSRNTGSAGIIFAEEGTYDFSGVSPSPNDNPQTFLTITKMPAADRAAVIIDGHTDGGYTCGKKVKFQGVNITSTKDYMLSVLDVVVFDSCIYTMTSADPFDEVKLFYFRNCQIGKIASGLQGYSGQVSSPAMIRGNTITNFDKSIMCYNVIGNTISDSGAGGDLCITDYSGRSAPVPDYFVFAYNKISIAKRPMAVFFTDIECVSGAAVVQNLFELYEDNSGNYILSMGMDYHDGDNVMIWYNTFAGERCLTAYNSQGEAAISHINWSLKNNIWTDYNIKTDWETDDVANAARIGNWEPLYMVGCEGNFIAELSGSAAAGSYVGDFAGINGRRFIAAQDSDLVKWESNKSFVGTQDGLGNYHLKSTSPARRLTSSWLLPYDLYGDKRGPGTAGDSLMAAGAYASNEDWPTGGAGVPTIDSIRAITGKVGYIFTVFGTDFGSSQNLGCIKLNSLTCKKACFWSPTLIQDTVPAGSPRGLYSVYIYTDTVAGVWDSLYRAFRVQGVTPHFGPYW